MLDHARLHCQKIVTVVSVRGNIPSVKPHPVRTTVARSNQLKKSALKTSVVTYTNTLNGNYSWKYI